MQCEKLLQMFAENQIMQNMVALILISLEHQCKSGVTQQLNGVTLV